MKVFVCVEDNNGMMFNRRRVSSDAVVTQRILNIAHDAKLWMNEYSSKLFAGADIAVASDFLEHAAEGEYCFVENIDIEPYADRLKQLIIYRWNRRYPSDFKFTYPLDGWRLVESHEFEGKSHQKVTEEVYMR